MKQRKKRSPLSRILRFLGALIGCLVLLAAAGILVLTVLEWRPADLEEAPLRGGASRNAAAGEELTLMTWNIGYGSLGDNADFFMDGGTMVKTADEARVRENLDGMAKTILAQSPDILFFQEVDRDSARSHHIDEAAVLTEQLPGYVSSFANNFKAAFVPYPIPPIGKVDSGLLTFSALNASQSQRIQLPIPFKWPIRMANLKRCVLLTRIPVESVSKELVLINLHLEAYDDGTGKAQQTAMLREILQCETDKGNYVIAGRDFNQIFSNVDASLYPVKEGLWAPGAINAEDFGASFSCLMDAGVPTCRSLDRPYAGADPDTFQFYAIDGFIVSNNVQVLSLQTLNEQFVCTDHNPVLLRVKLSDE